MLNYIRVAVEDRAPPPLAARHTNEPLSHWILVVSPTTAGTAKWRSEPPSLPRFTLGWNAVNPNSIRISSARSESVRRQQGRAQFEKDDKCPYEEGMLSLGAALVDTIPEGFRIAAEAYYTSGSEHNGLGSPNRARTLSDERVDSQLCNAGGFVKRVEAIWRCTIFRQLEHYRGFP